MGVIDDLPIFKSLGMSNIDPEKEALIFLNDNGSDERLTYGRIFENTNRISHLLLKAGIGKGDTFAIVMRNHPEFLYCLFAALSIGAIAVPIDPRSRGAKLSYQIKNTGSKGIILADEMMENLTEITKDIEGIPVLGIIYKEHVTASLRHSVAHTRGSNEKCQAIFAFQALLDDLHVEQAKKAAAEAESQCL